MLRMAPSRSRIGREKDEEWLLCWIGRRQQAGEPSGPLALLHDLHKSLREKPPAKSRNRGHESKCALLTCNVVVCAEISGAFHDVMGRRIDEGVPAITDLVVLDL